MDYYNRSFTLSDVACMLQDGRAVNGSKGVIVLGKSHDNGGVKFLVREGNSYLLKGELEGYEFILNLGASSYYSKSFHHFNKYYEHIYEPFIEYNLPSDIKLINTMGENFRYLVFDDNFSIVNKYSTHGYLKTLDQMNKSINFKILKNNKIFMINNQKEDIKVFFKNEYAGILPALRYTTFKKIKNRITRWYYIYLG